MIQMHSVVLLVIALRVTVQMYKLFNVLMHLNMLRFLILKASFK